MVSYQDLSYESRKKLHEAVYKLLESLIIEGMDYGQSLINKKLTSHEEFLLKQDRASSIAAGPHYTNVVALWGIYESFLSGKNK